MDRIAELFARCHRENRAALIIYSCCGYPAPGADETAFETAIAAGADIIELGVPFSDPMADGPVICTASQRALANGTKFRDVLALAGRLRQRHPETGIIVFSYMNVLYNFGLERLCTELAAIGVDGILAVDLPLEERDELLTLCRKNQLHLIPLVAPETPDERAEKIVAPATGFVYCVSRNGVTGESATLPPELTTRLEKLRRVSPVPVAVGFGISTPQTAHEIARVTDGIIAGSAFVRSLTEPEQSRTLVAALATAAHR